ANCHGGPSVRALLLQLFQSVPRVTQRGVECDRGPVGADRQRQVVVHLVRGRESVSRSSRRWIEFDIGFKGPNGIPQVSLTYQVLTERVQPSLIKGIELS